MARKYLPLSASQLGSYVQPVYQRASGNLIRYIVGDQSPCGHLPKDVAMHPSPVRATNLCILEPVGRVPIRDFAQLS